MSPVEALQLLEQATGQEQKICGLGQTMRVVQ